MMPPGDRLAPSDRAFIDEAVRRTDAAWRSTDDPGLQEILPPPSHPLRARALVEVLKRDMRYRWRTGRRQLVEQYLEEWPELRGRRGPRRELVEAECRERAVVSGELSLDEITRRFPGDVESLSSSHIMADALRARRDESLDGRGRFLLIRKLGEGGMGVVYDVLDRERESRVAAKRLPRIVPERLYWFKQEFRSLSDLQHPNLVGLHQLVSDGDEWILTMDLVDGSDFVQWIRGPDRAAAATAGTSSETAQQVIAPAIEEGLEGSGHGEPIAAGTVSPLGPADVKRLRAAMLQLARGVAFLHANGKLHRDLKPANVLVCNDGRVKILDFGIVAELPSATDNASSTAGARWSGSRGDGHERTGRIAGTVQYMAPEQLEGRDVGPASDWYAVGEMLFAALSGQPPFGGSTSEIVGAKLLGAAPSVRRYAPDAPDDLATLCDELLAREPRGRLTGEQVLSRLGADDDDARESVRSASNPFVGRQREMQQLRAARDTRPTTIWIHGRSGMGKTALLSRFVDELAADPDVVVLGGRCYEQESVPYKAVDSLVDSLRSFLLTLGPAEIDGVLPRHMAALSQMFKVLQGVEREVSVRAPPEAHDPQELRSRASHALREVLSRIGDRHDLVVLIDDLQWGDFDSANLLIDLLRPPDAPRSLTVLCYREEYADTSVCLQMLREATRGGEAHGALASDLMVGPLSASDALELARQMLDAGGVGGDAAARRVGEESGGNPYFLLELARHSRRASQTDGDAGRLELDDVLWRRVLALDDPARALIETVATAGQPVQLRLALDAAGIGHDEWRLVAGLRNEHFLRGSGPRLEDRIETYHDRIRESVVRQLPPEVLQQRHAALADAIRAGGDFDPETLATHLSAGGREVEAARYFSRAADEAVAALAFDRAARLYRRCLETDGDTGLDSFRLRVELAGALANAGRGRDAAVVYEEAARALPEGPERLDLERSAATQYCLSGHTDEGRVAFRRLTAAHGLRFPANKMAQLLWLLWQRTRLRLRGLSFEAVAEDRVPVGLLRQIDLLWAMSAGLSVPEGPAVAGLQTQGLLLALRAGEPGRLARALACEAFLTAATGWSVAERCNELLDRATDLARQLDDPKALGMARVAAGMVALLQMRFRDAETHSVEAERILTAECTGVAWEVATARTVITWSLWHRGEYLDLARRVSRYLNEVRERGDLYTVTNLETVAQAFLRLAADDPDGADALVDRSLAAWGVEGFHLQHLSALYTKAHILLYRGEGRRAYEHVVKLWPDLRRSLHLYTQLVRFTTHDLRARTGIAAAYESGSPGALRRRVRADARRLRREETPWPPADADMHDAGLALLRSDPEVAERHLHAAVRGYVTREQSLHAAAARYVLGKTIGGDQGVSLQHDGRTTFERQRIVKPEKFIAMLTFGRLTDSL